MGQKPQILVDTDILIKVYRGDDFFRKILENFRGRISISVVTQIELLYGLRIKSRVIELNKQLRAYTLIHIDEKISQLVLKVVKAYTVKNNMGLADASIAATALYHQLPLFTYNKKDFDFIKGLSLYEAE